MGEGIGAIAEGKLGWVAQGLFALLIFVYMLRQGWLTWSRDKVSAASDSANLQVLESLRSEIKRLNEQLTAERKYCDDEFLRLSNRIDVLEKERGRK